MPLTGELEHLPIVDVIQLIHSTKKSGTLNVFSRNGEGQLTFNNGYIISATHSNEKLKIGSILLQNQIIDQKTLDKALGIQELSDDDRKPLLSTLINYCDLSKEAAFKALEMLIEMTVVEMICWSKGIFTLDVDEITVSDDYHYLPKQLQTISLDTQMVLMDALRIFDEKVHAGELQLSNKTLTENPLEKFEEVEETEESLLAGSGGDMEISADLLGLADLDKVKRKKPHIFKVLEAFDPAEIHRQIIDKTLPTITEKDKEKLVSFLSGVSIFSQQGNRSSSDSDKKSQAAIIYSDNEFLQHALMTICKHEGILVFVTADPEKLNNLIERAFSKDLDPVLIFGSPEANTENFNKKKIIDLRSQQMTRHPHLSMIQFVLPLDFSFSLESLNDGSRAVFPLPDFSERVETFTVDIINFLNTFQRYIRSCFNNERRKQYANLRNSLTRLKLLRKAPDISLLMLQFTSEIFARTLTLIVDKSDLIAERSIGIFAPTNNNGTALRKFRIPIHSDSLFHQVIDSGDTFLGVPTDNTLAALIYPAIGAPIDTTCLLLPLKSNNRVITITYADFGNRQANDPSLDFIEFFANQAGIAIKNILFSKHRNNANQPENRY